jgi:hypothetical protein
MHLGRRPRSADTSPQAEFPLALGGRRSGSLTRRCRRFVLVLSIIGFGFVAKLRIIHFVGLSYLLVLARQKGFFHLRERVGSSRGSVLGLFNHAPAQNQPSNGTAMCASSGSRCVKAQKTVAEARFYGGIRAAWPPTVMMTVALKADALLANTRVILERAVGVTTADGQIVLRIAFRDAVER